MEGFRLDLSAASVPRRHGRYLAGLIYSDHQASIHPQLRCLRFRAEIHYLPERRQTIIVAKPKTVAT
jgi:hypothetical protein